MATGRVPTTANSPLTAKGDLFGYSTTQARVPVGNDGETIVADSSTSTGLRYQGSITGGKNFVINGGMDIWQRGTTFTVSGLGFSSYTVDRWASYSAGAGTISQDTSLSASGFRYALKFTSTAASSGNGFYQLIETDQTVPLAGKQVAVSGYALSVAGKLPLMNLEYSTTVNDGLFGSWVQATKTTISEPTATGSLLRYTYSFAVPTTAKTLRISLQTGTLNNTESTIWAGVQLEVGNVPTLFSRAGGTIQGELAACQRYYYRSTSSAGSQTSTGISGITNSTTNLVGYFNPPVPMRVTPTAVEFSSIGTQTTSSGLTAISAVAIVNESTNSSVSLNLTSSGFTANLFGLVRGTTGTGYIGLSAEL